MNDGFKREQRYLTIKISDLKAAGLSPSETAFLYNILFKVNLARARSDKKPLECVVIESDWPEYAPTWKAIEERMSDE